MKEKNRGRLEKQRDRTRNRQLLGPALTHFSDPEKVPRLPTPRKRALSVLVPGTSYGVNSLFGKIPPEIRQEILALAFGYDILHVQLIFEHPAFPHASGRREHCNIQHSLISDTLHVDHNQPKRWRWVSCICHDVKPPHLRDSWDRYDRKSPRVDDQCCLGKATHCKKWPGAHPAKCKVGVMGWLLSCRQAYLEGTQILYAKNGFHMTSQLLLANIEYLLLPQRLATITSLYVSWPLILARNAISPEESQMMVNSHNLTTILVKLSTYFNGLKELNLQLKSNESLKNATIDVSELFKPLDSFFAKHPTIQDFTVTLSATLFQFIKGVFFPMLDRPDEVYVKRPLRGLMEYWRGLDGNLVHTGDLDVPYPTPPHTLQGETMSRVKRGYWIMEGEKEEEPPDSDDDSDDDDGRIGFIIVD